MPTHQESLEGKKIWITGASSGIGQQLAIACSLKGANLVLSARKLESLHNVKEQCLYPERVDIQILDQSNNESVVSAAENTISKHGAFDYLFLCGGVSQRSLVTETSVSIDRMLMEINFFSNISLTKAVLPGMIQQGSGTITVISSLTGKWGFYLRSAYSASKHALHGFYDSLRMEVEKKGIQITLVTPGFIATEISKSALDSQGNPTGEMDPNQSNGMPVEECARIILEKTLSGKTEFGVGGREIIGLTLKRFFPSYFEKILRKQSAK